MALAGCGARSAKVMDVSTMVASNVMLAADATYTVRVARDRWSGGRHEIGMPALQIMGPTPSASAVGAYFVGAIAVNTALWIALPPKWRSIIPGMIIGAQADALAWDYAGCRWCP